MEIPTTPPRDIVKPQQLPIYNWPQTEEKRYDWIPLASTLWPMVGLIFDPEETLGKTPRCESLSKATHLPQHISSTRTSAEQCGDGLQLSPWRRHQKGRKGGLGNQFTWSTGKKIDFGLGSGLLRMLAVGTIATGNLVSHTLASSNDTGMVKSIPYELYSPYKCKHTV